MRTRQGSEQLRVVVAGLMGSLPIAGLVSHYLQYVLGLRKLGHDVLYLEDTGFYFDPATKVYVDRWRDEERPPSDAMPPAVLDRLLGPYGLGDRWTWVDIDGECHGLAGERLSEFLSSADLFLHLTGVSVLRDEYHAIPRRAYVDTDPGFVQLRAAAELGQTRDRDWLQSHNVHFTFGCNIGQPGCRIPEVGLTWHPTVQPIDLDFWPAQPPPPPGAPFTTIVKWSPYSSVEHEGIVYGMKDVEFVKFLHLPRAATGPFELAMDGPPPVPESRLVELGWRVADGLEVSATLERYRAYIAASRAEWSVAKQAYVATWSGWFSERSAAYLASGRPVVLQSTGFERWLPVGAGVLAFSDDDDLMAALDAVDRDYECHSRAARELAREHFRADMVLQAMLDRCAS
ncbi:MAG: hypothetical protein M3378_12895 [Actinomycetota bacterium]|nr:hypothetical protein [Actinomycetota bacterium]